MTDEKKTKTVKKTTVPHPDEAGGHQAKHIAAARHMLDQVEAGHYKIGHSTRSDHPHGGHDFHFHLDEADATVEAVPHGL